MAQQNLQTLPPHLHPHHRPHRPDSHQADHNHLVVMGSNRLVADLDSHLRHHAELYMLPYLNEN